MIRRMLQRLTWRTLSMLIGQASMIGFGAHLILTGQMSDVIGLAIVLGIMALAVIGTLGEAGARHVVSGIRAWRAPAAPEPPPEHPPERASGGPGPGGPS